MIDHSIIVPYRRHSITECDEILRQHNDVDRSVQPLKITPSTHWQWIEALREVELEPWTVKFIDSVEDYLTIKGCLTPKQAERLEEIYVAKTK